MNATMEFQDQLNRFGMPEEHQQENVSCCRGLDELWDVTRQLQKRLEVMEARAAEAEQHVDPKKLEPRVDTLHGYLDEQFTTLYKKHSEALAAQVAKVVQGLHG